MGGVDVLPVSNALKRRTITALSLVPLVIAAVLWLPTPAFALVLAGVLMLAAVEWCTLAGLTRPIARALYPTSILGVMALVWIWPQAQPWFFGLSALWWVVQAFALPQIREIPRVEGVQWSLLPAGFLVLVGPWAALIHLHGLPDSGPALVLFLLFLMWTADSMAYFVGRAWGDGRAKLAPVLSPGKTRVGVYGAIVGAAVCGLAFSRILSASPTATLLILLVCGVAVVISIVGDLYESLLKRRRGLKDSSHLLPGHGGMLDRIDSLTAAAPVFALGLTLIGVAT
ncbi:phosphatidate cytidylyltransferase [Thiocapsa marina]|uniref:Phosphatidate cytidylyltransferase n=1 Tax=Thiocapsa marina 5811 TaxID=768671 RepID=F9UAI4_9GAMM|nr:phosphatidate cytidylyltransferase [Thiocapsa marina]EGV18736.1 phosphatidate cytidylyltransferase [Thiocapsa marina 5811]